jgi:hypothetical protein
MDCAQGVEEQPLVPDAYRTFHAYHITILNRLRPVKEGEERCRSREKQRS